MNLQDVVSLIESDRAKPKRLAIVGDTMLDEWITAEGGSCQDGCPCVKLQSYIRRTPGGAAGAARQLHHWHSTASLIGLVNGRLLQCLRTEAPRVNTGYCLDCMKVPVKGRYVDPEGRILFRADQEADHYGMCQDELSEARESAIRAIRTQPWDAVLLVDYEKGFLDDSMIRRVIEICRDKQTPVIADPKRPPAVFEGAILKVNNAYYDRHCIQLLDRESPFVVTRGGFLPVVGTAAALSYELPQKPVWCRNHVGAGDCFGMHLALAVAHTSYKTGSLFSSTVEIADAAARVYVQHLEGRPPWPHEVCRQTDPIRGKVVSDVRALRESLSGRVVFTNGVFRLPHAGHAWLLQWARRQGDVLVVGINDDASAARQRPGEYVMPLAERIELLAGLGCVDWIVPFAEDTPTAVVEALLPCLLVKGSEYRDSPVPGREVVTEFRCAPESPYPAHATSMIQMIQGG